MVMFCITLTMLFLLHDTHFSFVIISSSYLYLFQNNFDISSHEMIQTIPCKFKNILRAFSASDRKKCKNVQPQVQH